MWTIFEAQYPLTIEVAFINVGTCTNYDGLFIVAKTGIEGTYRWGYSMYKNKNFGNRKSLSSTNPLPLIRNKDQDERRTFVQSSHNRSTTTNNWLKSYTTPNAVLDISDVKL